MPLITYAGAWFQVSGSKCVLYIGEMCCVAFLVDCISGYSCWPADKGVLHSNWHLYELLRVMALSLVKAATS